MAHFFHVNTDRGAAVHLAWSLLWNMVMTISQAVRLGVTQVELFRQIPRLKFDRWVYTAMLLGINSLSKRWRKDDCCFGNAKLPTCSQYVS
jgi:hypothetical protein